MNVENLLSILIPGYFSFQVFSAARMSESTEEVDLSLDKPVLYHRVAC